jgi:hypothetical protein
VNFRDPSQVGFFQVKGPHHHFSVEIEVLSRIDGNFALSFEHFWDSAISYSGSKRRVINDGKLSVGHHDRQLYYGQPAPAIRAEAAAMINRLPRTAQRQLINLN